MPKLRSSSRSPLGAIGTVRTFANVLREMSFDDVREEALQSPRLLILAPDEAQGDDLARVLTGMRVPRGVDIRSTGERIDDLTSYNAVIVHDPVGLGAATRLRERTRSADKPVPIVEVPADGVDAPGAAKRLRASILRPNLDQAPAIGRAYPAFRETAVKLLIDEAAMANAQFALVSNIPAVIPIVGSLVAAGADFLVLTKNQLMLIYKIAAVHERDLSDQFAVMREMVPVVGAGLFWRTVAREVASFVPFMAGTIPKVVIAFTGTVAAGRGMDFYYRSGRKPSREQMREYYKQAVEVARNLPLPRPGRNGSKAELPIESEKR